LRIEAYFQHIQHIIAECPIVQLSNVTYETRGTYEGFIRGELYFIDSSCLHIREFLDVEITVERLMYAYQYMTASEELIFRYDNTGHHRQLDLPTYPHHKHEGSEDHVIASYTPELADVLQEIELLVKLS
jgi:hypothetical protein